jgi:hypothetical protein
MTTSYNMKIFVNYENQSLKTKLALIIISVLLLNSLSVIQYSYSKKKIDLIIDKMDDVFDLSSSSSAYNFLIGLAFSSILDMQAVRFNSDSQIQINALYISKMEEYIKKFTVLTTSENLGNNSRRHICLVSLDGFVAEDSKLDQKALLNKCMRSVQSQEYYTPMQAASHLTSVYKEMKLMITTQRTDTLYGYLQSEEFVKDNESIMYFLNGLKQMLNLIIEKLLVEITEYNDRVNWQIYVFALILVGILVVYKFVWFPHRSHSWHKIRTCLLYLNDQLLLSSNAKTLLQ